MAALSHLSQDFDCTFTTSIATRDHEDHTFNGMYFSIAVNGPEDGGFPVAFVRLDSISVRGALGPMTVWVSPGGLDGLNSDVSFAKRADRDAWRIVHSSTKQPSFQRPVPLLFDQPIILEPGQIMGIYVHSARHMDDGIVYDNLRGRYGSYRTYKDDVISVHAGYAHLSSRPFGTTAPWGGTAWRSNRAFVGKIDFGARFLLWTPDVHDRFPKAFRECSSTLTMMHATSWDGLPAEVVRYVLNFCPADWFRESEEAWKGNLWTRKPSAVASSVLSGLRVGKSKENGGNGDGSCNAALEEQSVAEGQLTRRRGQRDRQNAHSISTSSSSNQTSLGVESAASSATTAGGTGRCSAHPCVIS